MKGIAGLTKGPALESRQNTLYDKDKLPENKSITLCITYVK